MQPVYDEGTSFLAIEWYEKQEEGTPKHRFFSRVPSLLQFHPKEKDRVFRVHFRGAMPDWMKKYAYEHGFRCQERTLNGETGWWLANWNAWPASQKPFSAPVLKGAIRQFAQWIPEVVQEFRGKVLDSIETIETNIKNYPDFYESLGFYFEPEKIQGYHSCILVDNIVPEREEWMGDDDYRSAILSDGKLEQLIYEIITPLPEPVAEEEGVLVEEEMSLNIEFEIDETFEFDFEFDVEETIEIVEEPVLLLSEDIEATEEIVVPSVDQEETIQVDIQLSEEIEMEPLEVEEPETIAGEEIDPAEVILKVVEHKKGNIIEGQLSLF